MGVFECVHFRSNLFRRIERQNRTGCLEDNRPFVVMFVYVMDRNTGLPFAGGNDRLVHVYPVHAFASVFRQKCRMNIDNLTRIGIQQGIGDLIHEAGKNNQIRIIFRKFCQDRFPICKFLPRKDKRRNPQLIHPGMYAYIPRVKKDGTPLTDKGGTQKFTRVRAVKENGVWGRYRKGDNGKYEFEQLPSGVHPHPECDRYFKVFNLSLIEGVPPLPVPDLAPNDDIEVGLLADDVIASSRCEVFEGSTDGAYYNFVNDKISVPSREAFNSNSSFLASLLHEMGHSTAPALDRQMTGDMRSKEYAHEEIVAELSSIFSSVDLAVKAETDPEAAGYGEHVAYLEFWKGRLDSVAGTDEYEATKEELCDDFFAAASQASQATDFIIDRYEQEVGHPAAGKEIVQKLDMPEKTEQEDRAVRSLSHKKETARDASAHMQGDRADLVNMRDENAIGA